MYDRRPDPFGLRLIGPQDIAQSELVTVVSESFAETVWPDQSALGETLVSPFEGKARTFKVIGVLAETRVHDLTSDNPFMMYVAQDQLLSPGSNNVLVMRTQLNPLQLEPILARLVREQDWRVAIADMSSMRQVIAQSMAEPLQLRFYLSLLGALALSLGAIGVFGVVNHSVTRRRPEYAVRLALGCSAGGLLKRVLLNSARPILLGVVAGIVGVGLCARWLGSFLYGLEPMDPLSISIGASALLSVALLAALLPAVQATQISPATTLRDS